MRRSSKLVWINSHTISTICTASWLGSCFVFFSFLLLTLGNSGGGSFDGLLSVSDSSFSVFLFFLSWRLPFAHLISGWSCWELILLLLLYFEGCLALLAGYMNGTRGCGSRILVAICFCFVDLGLRVWRFVGLGHMVWRKGARDSTSEGLELGFSTVI